MPALITREEHQRRQRRRRRQLMGCVVVALVLLGVIHLIQMATGFYQRVTDPTDAMMAHQSMLRSVVMYDPVSFDGLENAPEHLIQESAVWGVVYEMLDDGRWDQLEKSEDDRSILPAVDVNAFISRLYGPNVFLNHVTFMDDFGIEYIYDEARQGYLIPVTSFENNYTPSVVEMDLKGGRRYVTVGYISNSAGGGFTSVTASGPQKYMDYIFQRGAGRNWYLVGLAESSRTVDASDIIQENNLENTADWDSLFQDVPFEDENAGETVAPAPEETSEVSEDGEESESAESEQN